MQLLPIIETLKLRKVHPVYLEAFAYADSQNLWNQYKINTPLRVSHFLAQILHESGGLTRLRENMNYSASRIVEVFGVNRHSAAITQSEAVTLAGNPEALAERVYGLGNPRKAKELGNTRKGDGWLFRGGGPLQNTGASAYRGIGDYIGVDLYSDPSLINDPRYALAGALWFWNKHKLNQLADKNDLKSITRRVNGGYNGYEDRMRLFNKVYKLLDDQTPAWTASKPNPEVIKLQKALNELGASLEVDGLMGPATERAIRDFQIANQLEVDGIAGPVTWSTIDLRLNSKKAVEPVVAPPKPTDKPEKSGIGLLVTSISGDQVINKVQEVKEIIGPDGNQYLQLALGILAVIGIGLIIYGMVNKYLRRNEVLAQ